MKIDESFDRRCIENSTNRRVCYSADHMNVTNPGLNIYIGKTGTRGPRVFGSIRLWTMPLVEDNDTGQFVTGLKRRSR